MAFTSSVVQSTVFGNLRVVIGTYTNTSGSTGGTISTGMGSVMHCSFSANTSSPSTQAVISGGSVTITTAANQAGTFELIGR